MKYLRYEIYKFQKKWGERLQHKVLERLGELREERIEWTRKLYERFDRIHLRMGLRQIKGRSDEVARERVRQARIRALTKRVERRIGIEMAPTCMKIMKRYLRKRQFKKAQTVKALQLRNFLLASNHFNALRNYTNMTNKQLM